MTGLVAYFLWQHHHYNTGPLAREIYVEVIAALSVLLSLVWMIPTLHNMLHYPMDLVMTAAWFAAFGLLVDYLDGRCGGAFHWAGLDHGGYCGRWKAAEAFSFIAACFWLASFLVVCSLVISMCWAVLTVGRACIRST